MSAHLLRAFESNHAAILDLVRQDVFDINALNVLMAARDGIIAEVAQAPFDEATLQGLHRKHKLLEAAVEKAMAEASKRMGRMKAGQRALGAYTKK